MSDRIRLAGLEVHARHGLLAEEQAGGQVFVVDVEVEIDLDEAAATDRLEATIDYAALARRIHDRVAEERWDLIERVAARVADLVLEEPRARAVAVTVHKPQAPLPVTVEDVSVTVHRP